MLIRSVLVVSAFLLSACLANASATAPGTLSFDLVEGGQVSLGDYRGKVVLIVNTASKCGYADQFTQLQDLADRFADKGLVILTVPSNDFRQEFSSAKEAKRYCAMTFGAELPMAQIAKVRGQDAHPFYAWLRAEEGFVPSWNFNKVLLGRDGGVIATYPAGVEPLSVPITDAISQALDAAM